jgi:hypothetical protein
MLVESATIKSTPAPTSCAACRLRVAGMLGQSGSFATDEFSPAPVTEDLAPAPPSQKHRASCQQLPPATGDLAPAPRLSNESHLVCISEHVCEDRARVEEEGARLLDFVATTAFPSNKKKNSHAIPRAIPNGHQACTHVSDRYNKNHLLVPCGSRNPCCVFHIPAPTSLIDQFSHLFSFHKPETWREPTNWCNPRLNISPAPPQQQHRHNNDN